MLCNRHRQCDAIGVVEVHNTKAKNRTGAQFIALGTGNIRALGDLQNVRRIKANVVARQRTAAHIDCVNVCTASNVNTLIIGRDINRIRAPVRENISMDPRCDLDYPGIV